MDQNIENLRTALIHSPDNTYLQLILTQALLDKSLYEEAISEALKILARETENYQAKISLAKAYLAKGDSGTAYIVLEEITGKNAPNAELCLLFSKVALAENEISKAIEYYEKAKVQNPSISDENLENSLKVKQNSVEEGLGFADQVEELVQPKKQDKVTFKNVGGLEAEKEEIRVKIIHPMKHASLYEAYGKKIGGGILFYGPPGCGKTYLAKATAGEIDASFISVGINDILDMYIGNSEKNLHAIFEQARSSRPCVLFFDEVDALGASRSDMKTSAGRNLINQFLAELDGIDSVNDGILVLGATNAPWHLDAAFRRPGRFDRILFIQPPDEDAREAILNVHLEGKPQKEIDFKKVASKLKDFSGADINALVDLVVEKKIQESLGNGIPTPIQTKDILKEVKKIKPSTKEWFVTARNYAMYANESGIYDDILAYLKIKK